MSLDNNVSVSFRKSSTDTRISFFYTFLYFSNLLNKEKKKGVMSHVKLWLEFSLLSWFVYLWQSLN